MKYYKLNNEVYAYDDEQVAMGLADDKEAITELEAFDIMNPPPTPEQLTQQAKSAIYTLLDTTAQQYDYRNFAEVSQFVLSGTWKAEADALLAWQDTVWVKAYELLKAPITSIDDFMAQLPKYVPSSGS